MNSYSLVSLRAAADENDLEKFKSTIEQGSRQLDGKTASEIAQRAASHGNLDIIQYLAEIKPSLLDKGAHFASARVAAEKGHLNVVRYLVEKEPSIMRENDESDSTECDAATLAEVATRSQHLDVLLYLAKKEATTFLEAKSSYSPDYGDRPSHKYALKLAIKQDILDEKTLKLLSPLSRYGLSICDMAAEQGNLDVVRYFVERDPSVLSNKPNEYYANIAHAAAYHSHWNVFWYIVEEDPSLLMKQNYLGHFPLFLAVQNNMLTAAHLRRLVQENKVQLGEMDKYGNNIAHEAAACGNLDIIIYIYETEPSIIWQRKDRRSRTVAAMAAKEGHWEIVKYLAVKNTSVYTESCIYSIFYEAVRDNSMNQGTLKYLLETQKVSLNLRESHGDGNLAQLSINNKNPVMFRYLVQKEPTLLSGEVKGMGTVGHVAIQERYLTEEIISTAVEKTPTLFAQKDDTNGNSFLHEAIKQCLINVKTLDKLLNKEVVILTEVNNAGDTLAHAAASAEDNRNSDHALKNTQVIAYIAKKQGSILAWKNCHGDNVALIAARAGHAFVLEEIVRINPSTILKTDREQNTVLHLLAAAEEQCITEPQFEMLVENGVPLRGTNWQGDTSAHVAARNDFVDLVEFVIRKEPTMAGLKNAAGRNIALTAAENAHYDVIRCIPDKELLLDRDNSGNTIFHLILQCGAFDPSEFTKTFQNITVPMDLYIKPNRDGVSVVHLAAQVGCSNIIERIAEKKPSILIEPTPNDTSVLHHAAKYSQLKVIKKILSSNEKYEDQTIHALFQFHNETEVFNIVRDLERNNREISNQARRHFDETAIHYAIESGYFTILKHLVRYRKVDVNQPNAKGEPPIFIAVRFKHYDMFEYLAERPGINFALTDHRGNNILFVALEMDDDLSTLKYVLDEKKVPLDVNWRNEAGDTILHRALRNAIMEGREYYSDTIHYLIEGKRVNINLPGLRNRTAITYAAEHDRFDICNYLLDHGADPLSRDETGKNFWDVSRFRVKQRRSVETGVGSLFPDSPEPRADEYVHRVTNHAQGVSEVLFSNYRNASFSLSGFSALAHVLLRRGKKDRRSSKHPLMGSSPTDLLYGKMDPIAADAVLGNQWK